LFFLFIRSSDVEYLLKKHGHSEFFKNVAWMDVTESRGSFWPLKCREGVAEATYSWNFTEAFSHNLTDGNHSVTCFF
jgi:hypothetical protein